MSLETPASISCSAYSVHSSTSRRTLLADEPCLDVKFLLVELNDRAWHVGHKYYYSASRSDRRNAGQLGGRKQLTACFIESREGQSAASERRKIKSKLSYYQTHPLLSRVRPNSLSPQTQHGLGQMSRLVGTSKTGNRTNSLGLVSCLGCDLPG